MSAKKKRKFKADTYKVREKARAIQMCKLWNTVMKNRAKILLEPDYIIWNGPVYQVGLFYQVATLARLSCNYKVDFCCVWPRCRDLGLKAANRTSPCKIQPLSVLKTAAIVYKGKLFALLIVTGNWPPGNMLLLKGNYSNGPKPTTDVLISISAFTV